MKASPQPLHSRLAEFCRMGAGGTPSRSMHERYYKDGSIPWVKSGELRETTLSKTDECITPDALKETRLDLVPPGAILVAMYGANVGRVGMLGLAAATNQAICHIVPDPKVAECRYLFHALRDLTPALIARGVGGAQPNISQGIVKDIELRLPPLREQRRIAEVLDRAEALRAKRRAALGLLDSLSQSIFLDMFGDPQHPRADIRSVGELLEFMTSGGRGWAKYYATSGSRFLRSLDVQMNSIGDRDIAYVAPPENAEARRTRVRSGDVLLTITGSLIGRAAALPDELAGSYVSQHVAILRPKATYLNPIFFAFFLSLPTGGQRQIASSQYGQTKPGLNFEQIGRFTIPLPPLPLQEEFARRIAAVERLKSAHRASLAALDTLFASLQHRAFRGEL